MNDGVGAVGASGVAVEGVTVGAVLAAVVVGAGGAVVVVVVSGGAGGASVAVRA